VLSSTGQRNGRQLGAEGGAQVGGGIRQVARRSNMDSSVKVFSYGVN
jgi:hypothetical protein